MSINIGGCVKCAQDEMQLIYRKKSFIFYAISFTSQVSKYACCN